MKGSRVAYLLILVLLCGYVMLQLVLPGKVPGHILAYVIRPAFWVAVALWVRHLPGASAAGRRGLRQELVLFGVMFGGFHVFMLVMGGIFSGFGNSPYSHLPLDVVRNIAVAAAALVGTEMARARILTLLGKRWPTLVIGLVSVFFTALLLPPTQFGQLGQLRPAVTYLGETLVPLLAINAFASVLGYLGGAKPAIAYRAVLVGFEWLSPVLPDMTWGITALVGVMVPALGVAAVQMLSSRRLRVTRRMRTEADEGPVSGWISGAVFILALFWFSLGLLPVYPATVITGSMMPLLEPGDVVIAYKVDPSKVQTGDVIDFRQGDIRVIHRVVDVIGEGEGVSFVTKGDANKTEDMAPVLAGNVKGRMVAVVPVVGRIVLFLRSA